MYRSFIGRLSYLTTGCLDIAYFVGVCALYQANPKVSHLSQAKRSVRYISGTADFGLLYSFDATSSLVGYCETDWAGSAVDRKSISESEYIAAGSNTQLLWMKQMLTEYGVSQDVVTLFCNNISGMIISKNQLADIFAKVLDVDRFEDLRSSLELCVIVQ